MTFVLTPEWVASAVSVGWLVLAVILVCVTYPLIARIVKERSFTVEIAGFKLSAQETAESLNSAIKDLQESVRRLEAGGISAATPSTTTSISPPARGGSILWVDDYPINNALIFEKLESDGFRVDRALSTREGLRMFSQRNYDIVLSDMGRNEGGVEVPDAGVVLTEALRKIDKTIPIFVYCSHRARDIQGQRARDAGANDVTTSAVELYGHIEDAMRGASRRPKN